MADTYEEIKAIIVERLGADPAKITMEARVREELEAEALDLVDYQLQSAKIIVTRDLDENLPSVVASWEHLKSVWLNLLLNARDALLHNNEQRRLEVATRVNKESQVVQVVLHDNGKGMNEAETVHIFEPFYTTKGPGQGTGLGLYIAEGIVRQHGGIIWAANNPAGGATVTVVLPRKA